MTDLQYYTQPNIKIDDTFFFFQMIQSAEKDLQNENIHDIFNTSDIVNQNRMLKQKNISKAKLALVKRCHVTSAGQPRTVRCVPNRKGEMIYKTRVESNKGVDITATTEDALYEKLYEYYCKKLGYIQEGNPYIFKNVWEAAHESYCRKHPTKKKTNECHEDDYKRFITAELAETDIRDITTDYLEDYALKFAQEHELIYSAYNALKGVINLVFDYAMKMHTTYPDIHYNPVKFIDNNIVYPLCKDTHAERTTEDIMDTAEELMAIIEEADRRSKMSQFHGYYIYSFMIKAHYEMGCRPGELVALKWTDIRTDPISGNKYFHIHASQRDNRDGNFEYLPFTKNEKGKSKGGRDFPINNNLDSLLDELKLLQDDLGIESEFIFCDETGEWKKTKDYLKALKSICDKLGIKSKGSYIFRHDVNNSMEQSGMSDASKGKAIGNRADTNRNYYCHAERDYVKQTREALEKRNAERSPLSRENSGHPLGHPQNIIIFPQKKSSRTANSQAFH